MWHEQLISNEDFQTISLDNKHKQNKWSLSDENLWYHLESVVCFAAIKATLLHLWRTLWSATKKKFIRFFFSFVLFLDGDKKPRLKENWIMWILSFFSFLICIPHNFSFDRNVVFCFSHLCTISHSLSL